MAQVQLIAAMCMGRSLNCMLAMRNEYPFLLVATAMSDHRLPPQVRMAFAELMNALYVDDVAHTKMEPPIEVRVFRDVPKFPELMPPPSADEAASAGGPEKLWLLEAIFFVHYEVYLHGRGG